MSKVVRQFWWFENTRTYTKLLDALVDPNVGPLPRSVRSLPDQKLAFENT